MKVDRELYDLLNTFELLCGSWPKEVVQAFAVFIEKTTRYRAKTLYKRIEELESRIKQLEQGSARPDAEATDRPAASGGVDS